ncbi:MAG TPA: type I glutamate--ammonia ligase [candidate division WOR-3 bacterium]|uniref:Type I glutamate--ammonia ligase n=1 Tax=candidate division WOR-3 bacterium TaxID=2052148 RepID=A0A7V0XG06_UNCW3|nr:type I glutamate--ammonia ligase [candidate division WOR-3 bacterium]
MQRAKDLIREHKVRFLDLKYSDVAGRLRHVTMPIERLEAAITDGTGFDGSSVIGFGTVDAGDMVLKPDFDTAFIDPFADQPTLSCLAAISDPLTGEECARDPRAVLRRALALVRDETNGSDLMVLPELEFYLFDSVRFGGDGAEAGYRVDADECAVEDRTGMTLRQGSAYHIAPPYDRSWDFRNELVAMMAGLGIPIKYHHHEGGRYSHVEVEPGMMPALQAADAVVLAKYLIRNLAFRCGRSATFMPKPLFGEPGSGMHFHQHLSKGGRSLFGDAASPTRLSGLALHYIAGILEHAPSLCGITNPSTNSYRRLVPGYEAPTLAFFSLGSRNAAIRIPGYVTDPDRVVIEYRIPDGTGNPYLTIAAMALAGLDGITRRLDAGMPFQGELRDAAEEFGSKLLPRSLPEALAALRKDSDYLCRADVFPTSLLEFWLGYRRAEADAVHLRPHPREYDLYYGC